jgi:hypothetical protein
VMGFEEASAFLVPERRGLVATLANSIGSLENVDSHGLASEEGDGSPGFWRRRWLRLFLCKVAQFIKRTRPKF